MESTITSKGQATIPKAVRERLGVGPGDRLKFFLHPDGSVVLLPQLPVTALRGMLRGTPRARRGAVSLAEMEEAAAAGAGGVRKARRASRAGA